MVEAGGGPRGQCLPRGCSRVHQLPRKEQILGMGKSCLFPPELSGLRIPGQLFSSLWLYAVEGLQLFFLETNQQLRCSSSVNQPNFFLILSHYFLIILPCSSLNKSSLLLVFTPSRYFSLLHRSGTAHRVLSPPISSVSLPHCSVPLVLSRPSLGRAPGVWSHVEAWSPPCSASPDAG